MEEVEGAVEEGSETRLAIRSRNLKMRKQQDNGSLCVAVSNIICMVPMNYVVS